MALPQGTGWRWQTRPSEGDYRRWRARSPWPAAHLPILPRKARRAVEAPPGDIASAYRIGCPDNVNVFTIRAIDMAYHDVYESYRAL